MRKVRSVLVVEDDELVRRAVLRLLQPTYQVFDVGSVAAAVAFLAEHTVDLVLSDYALGDGTAEEVLSVMLETTPVPLFIVMSGMADFETVFELGHLGVGAYVTKPFDRDSILAAIEKARKRSFPIALMAASAVGNMSARNLAGSIRDVMHGQAMALAQGNKTHAAMLLRIQRQSLGK